MDQSRNGGDFLLEMLVLVKYMALFFFIIAIGYGVGRRQLLSPTIGKDLSYLLLNVTMPCMILNSVIQPYDEKMSYNVMRMLLFTVGMFVLSAAVTHVIQKILRVLPEHQGVWLFQGTFSNIGFMGFPVILAVLGEQGLFLASIGNMAFNLGIYTLGIAFMTMHRQGHQKFNWKVLVSNANLAVLAGMVFYFGRIPLPEVGRMIVNSLGNMTTPLSMLILGLYLSQVPLGEVFREKSLYAIAALRLIGIPGLLMGIFRLFPQWNATLVPQTLILIASMPAPVIMAIMAKEYGDGSPYATKSTMLSTILSLGTIPVMYGLMQRVLMP